MVPKRDRRPRAHKVGQTAFIHINSAIRMAIRTIVLDGREIFDLSSFYDEIESKLTRDLGWDMGRNLDAFNDVLRGGFGVYEYDEPVRLVWEYSEESRADLGWKETVEYLQFQLGNCHPDNVPLVKEDLEKADRKEGVTLFDIIVDIIREHGHVELVLA
jgi:RNAse (barnase) inhibitor barstar